MEQIEHARVPVAKRKNIQRYGNLHMEDLEELYGSGDVLYVDRRMSAE